MSFDRGIAYELGDNGLLFENGAHFSSGTATPTHSGLKGDRFFKTDDASIWRLEADGTNWMKDVIKGSNEIIFAFSGNSSPFVSTSLTSYQIISEFIFPGSTLVSTPTSIFLLSGSNNASAGVSFKIFDRTNSLTIAEKTGIQSATRVENTLGTISNVPTGSSVFEIQAKRDDAGATAELSAIRMEFL